MTQLTTTYRDYSDASFWSMVTRCAKSVGKDLLYLALCLYYAMQNPAMPMGLKLSVMASLAYLVCPVDAIPDFIPVLGYTDDAGVLAATLATVSAYVDEDVERKARAAADKVFG